MGFFSPPPSAATQPYLLATIPISNAYLVIMSWSVRWNWAVFWLKESSGRARNYSIRYMCSIFYVCEMIRERTYGGQVARSPDAQTQNHVCNWIYLPFVLLIGYVAISFQSLAPPLRVFSARLLFFRPSAPQRTDAADKVHQRRARTCNRDERPARGRSKREKSTWNKFAIALFDSD